MIESLRDRFSHRRSTPGKRKLSFRPLRAGVEPLEERRLLAAATTISIKPCVQEVTPSSTVILWETGQDCTDNQVYYRVAGSGGAFNSVTTDRNTDTKIAEMQITGLSADTEYEFRVRSKAAKRNNGYSPSSTDCWSFKTFPNPTSPPSQFTFVAYGDTRTNATWHQGVANDVAAQNPAYVIHVGDAPETGEGDSYRSQWKSMYFDPATNLLNGVVYSQPTHRPAVPVIPVQGNHEYAGSGTHWYYSYMSVPNNGVSGDAEKYFSFTYGNVFNIGLNTVADDYPSEAPSYAPGSNQYNWLVSQLQSTAFQNATWHVVYMHHPAYTWCQGHSESANVQNYLVPLFEQYGVDMVFYGHSHVYERYVNNGVQYVLSGGGGAPGHYDRTDQDTTPPVRVAGLFCDATDTDKHLQSSIMDVDVPNRTLSYECYAHDRSLGFTDTFMLTKPALFSGGVLSVYGDATVSATPEGFVTVNGKTLSGLVRASQVTQLRAFGLGADLSGVTAADGFAKLGKNVQLLGNDSEDLGSAVVLLGVNTASPAEAGAAPKLIDTAAVDQVMAREVKVSTPAASESGSLLGGSASSPAAVRAKDALFGDAGVELRTLKLRRLGSR